MDYVELAVLAEKAARAAGVELLSRFGKKATGVVSKSSPTDLVSDADRAADRVVQDVIREVRPSDLFLTEESGALGESGAVRWIVDPLDGTVNFLYGRRDWAVSIAAEVEGEVVAGVVFQPTTGECFRGVRGGGATLDGRTIRASGVEVLAEALVATGFYYDVESRIRQAELVARIIPKCRDIRRPGACSLDLAAVACGRVDAYYEAPLGGFWDMAAGALLVEEAGGTVRRYAPPWAKVAGLIAGSAPVIAALEAELRPAQKSNW